MLEEQKSKLPIDKGWAWVIVFSSCALFALCTGGFKCQGIILVELIERYENVYSASSLIWVFTVHNILLGLFGPLGSILVGKLGHRGAAMLAVILMTLAYVGLAYSNSLLFLILTFSLPGGLSNTLLELSTILINDQYFNKRKALAFGIVMSGSGLGSIIIPIVMRPLFDHFSYAGASLLYGGFCLQFLIFASLMRPISFYKKETRKMLSSDQQKEENSDDVELQEYKGRNRSSTFSCSPPEKRNFCSMPILPADEYSEGNSAAISHSASKLVIKPTEACQSAEEAKEVGFCLKIFDWKILLIPKFLIITTSILFFDLGVLATYAVLPALANETGVSKEAVAVALVVGGCVEIPSRIGNGYLADRKLISTIEQYALCTLCTGILTLLCAFIPGLPGVAIGIAGLSIFGTSFFNLVPVLLREIMGGENLRAGMGINLLIQSIAFTAGSYIIGALYDSADSWHTVFYFFSAAMMFSSCLTWPYSFHSFYLRLHAPSNGDINTQSIELQTPET